MARSTTLWKVSAAAVPVLLLGSMSLATLSANASLESAFGADGVFGITVDGATETTASFDVDTLKPGETATKVVTVKNVGDASAYTWLDGATITGDAAFGSVLTGTVEGGAVTATGVLSELTSLTEGSWLLAPGEEMPVTLTVTAPVGPAAVIEGDVVVSFEFEASSTVPAIPLEVTFSRSASYYSDVDANVARYEAFYGRIGSQGARTIVPIDLAGPGLSESINAVVNSGYLPYAVTITSDAATVPGMTPFGDNGAFLWNVLDTPVGVYTLTFDVDTLDGVGGSVVSTTPYSLTINIVA